MKSLLGLAVRNFLSRKLRSTLTLLGIALGVALIFAVGITKEGVVESYVSLVSDLSGASDLQITTTSQTGFDPNLLEKIKNVEGVEEAVPSISKMGFLVFNKTKREIYLLGIDPERDRRLRHYQLEKGSFLSSKHARSILLVEEWSEKNNLRLSEEVQIATTSRPLSLKIEGLISKVGPGKIQGGAVGIIPLNTAQKIFALKDKITHIDIKVDKNTSVKDIQQKIKKRLGASFLVSRPESKGKTIETTTKGMMQAFDSFALLTLFIGIFVVFNTMTMNISERRREIGMLRTVGMTRYQILRLVILEASCFGLGGSFLGLLWGWQVATMFSQTASSVYHLPPGKIVVPFEAGIVALLAGIGGSIIAALHPAWQATQVAPLDALQPERTSQKKRVEKYSWLGGAAFILGAGVSYLAPTTPETKVHLFNVSLMLFSIGMSFLTIILIFPLSRFFSPLFQFIFNPEGRIARENLNRAKARNALAVVTLLVSLTMVIAAGELRLSDHKIMTRWINSILTFDLSIRNPLPISLATTDKYPSLNPDLRRKINKVKGIKVITPVKFMATKGLGRDLFLIFIEPKTFRKVSRTNLEEGNLQKALRKMEKGDSVLISATISKKYNLHLGDTLKLKTPQGKRNFDIVGVILELGNDGYSLYLSRKDQKRYFNNNGVDAFNLLLSAKANQKKTKKALEKRIGNPYHLLVLSNTEVRKTINASLNRFLSLLDSLALIAIFISSLGIINTLAMNVLERIREIGVLRAVGSTRWQIGKLILAEAGYLGSIGGLLGIFTGLAVSKIVINIANIVGGWPISYIFPLEYILISTIIAMGVSTTSAFYPAYQAAKIDIVKAVQYE